MKKLGILIAILVIVCFLLPLAHSIEAQESKVDGWEVVSARTECSKTYDLGGGRYVLESGLSILHYKDDYDNVYEQWKDIDLTWDKNTITRAPYILVVDGLKTTLTNKRTGAQAVIEPLKVGVDKASTSDFQVVPFSSGVRIVRVVNSLAELSASEFTLDIKGQGILLTTSARDADGDSIVVDAQLKDGKLTESIGNYSLSIISKTGISKQARFPITIDPTLDVNVAAGTDDVGVEKVSGAWSSPTMLTAAQIYVGRYQSAESCMESGFRFLNITIPVGSTITDAYLTITAGDTDTQPTVNTRTYGQLSANPDTFSSNVTEYVTRPLTTHSVDWDSVPAFTKWGNYTTGNITPIVQEIIDQGAWASGNAIVIFWGDRDDRSVGSFAIRTVAAYENTVYTEARIHIQYDVPSIAPSVTTLAATSVEETTAVLNGNITTSSPDATSRGFDWGTASGVYTGHTSESGGSWGAGTTFACSNGTFVPGTLYYYIARATNIAGRGNGSELTFLTKPEPPTGFMAIHGLLHNDLQWTTGVGANNTIVYALEGAYPAADRSDGAVLYNGTAFVALDSPLVYGEHWYYRAWSWSSNGGLAQWSDTSVVADATPYTTPTVGNMSATVNSSCSVTLLGNVTLVGDTSIQERGFDWGIAPGVYTTHWTETNPAGWGVGNFTYTWTSATEVTTYFWRAKALTSDNEWGFSGEGNFTTNEIPAPTVDTVLPATDISYTTAIAHGEVTNLGDPCPMITVRGFEYGLVSGIYTGNETEIGSWPVGTFALTLSGLPVNTLVYYRAHAYNGYEIGYGAEGNFTTLLPLPCAPTDLVATQTGIGNITITWTTGCYGNNTIIRISSEGCPADPSDGFLVYYGNYTNSVSYSGLELNMNTYCIRAWTENATGNSTGYAESKIGGGSMVFIGFLGFTALLSFIAVKGRWFGFNLMSGFAWLGMFAYIKDNPPMGITEGSSVHIIFMLICFGMMAMVVLAGLRRGVNTSRAGEGFSVGEQFGKWHLPEWTKGEGTRRKERKQRSNDNLDDYRARFHRALNPGEGKSRWR